MDGQIRRGVRIRGMERRVFVWDLGGYLVVLVVLGERVICISIIVVSAERAIENYEHFIFDSKLNFSR